jgi:hypothetical protein
VTIHLIKLCVGIETIDELRAWQHKRKRIEHWTRMTPKRADDLLAGGSLYWVIKGRIQARQKVLALDSGVTTDGVPHCVLVLDKELVAVAPRNHRAFQGWRYLEQKDAPKDLSAKSTGDLSAEMAAALSELGLL